MSIDSHHHTSILNRTLLSWLFCFFNKVNFIIFVLREIVSSSKTNDTCSNYHDALVLLLVKLGVLRGLTNDVVVEGHHSQVACVNHSSSECKLDHFLHF